MRIGHAFDIHKLGENRKLILGGILIPYDKGLIGHSDADVVMHVATEALLGSLALGDLGSHFPDNDDTYKDIDSALLLVRVYTMVKQKGYILSNIDITIYAEEPKMQEYIPLMRANLATILATRLENISIKATTYEKLDAIGNKQAIAAEAIVLVKQEI